MERLIMEKLEKIERQENCRVLLAVECGSRAWGFESAGSDYDVRFLYARPTAFYLKLEPRRDVIELPISDKLDISGWDIDKALRLLHKSNPAVFEWLSSPIIYRDSPFAGALKRVMPAYFSPKSALFHYLHTAEENVRIYLSRDMVKLKKYLYALRPVLACRWILENGTPPPMRFSELMESQLEDDRKPAVRQLLRLKINSPETEQIPRIDELNRYLLTSIAEIREQASRLPKEAPRSWETANALFLSALEP